jgi:hypothetical protein
MCIQVFSLLVFLVYILPPWWQWFSSDNLIVLLQYQYHLLSFRCDLLYVLLTLAEVC